jgi:NAD(P)-dependent dehydrogenase (short-subunit alcohol dehydrogenase family)
MDKQKVWFITGASKGFGLELVNQLLALGHQVAATSRNADELREAANTQSADFLPLGVELTNETSVADAVEATIEKFGRIDVVVNNAGYGQLGALEELTDAESRANFDVNVFGLLNVTRKVLPQLRKQQSGHVLNVSSIAGITGAFPGWGIYCATKFAVEGLTESFAAEVAPFNIKVTLVEPGYFRTSFLKSGSMRSAGSKNEAYELVRQSEAYHAELEQKGQPGDPVKGVEAIIRIVGEANPPLHFLLGPDAVNLAEAKIESLQKDIAQWRELSVSTDFDK